MVPLAKELGKVKYLIGTRHEFPSGIADFGVGQADFDLGKV